MGAGFLLGLVLAVLSAYSIGIGGIEPRQAESWISEGRLLVTQAGFPEGRAVFPVEEGQAVAEDGTTPLVPRFADPGRLADAATLLALLIDGDGVNKILLQDGPPVGELFAEAETLSSKGPSLPIIRITGASVTADRATVTAQRGMRAFTEFVQAEQERGQIPERQRLQLKVLREPVGATLLAGRSLTSPIVLFAGVLIGSLILAMGLENLRSRRQLEPWGGRPRGYVEPYPLEPDPLSQEFAEVASGRPLPTDPRDGGPDRR